MKGTVAPVGPCKPRNEYIRQALSDWTEENSIALAHIQPSQLQQNAYIERYNRTVRHQWLHQYINNSIEEAQHFATQWLWAYNNDRPNMDNGGITPVMKLIMAAEVLRPGPVKNGRITTPGTKPAMQIGAVFVLNAYVSDRPIWLILGLFQVRDACDRIALSISE